jgi:hypothetical protein
MYDNNGLILPFFPGYWMGAVSSAATWPQFRSIDPLAQSPSATSYTHWGEASAEMMLLLGCHLTTSHWCSSWVHLRSDEACAVRIIYLFIYCYICPAEKPV